MEKKKGTKKTTNEKPLSLAPLTPEEALKKLLSVKPPPKKKALKIQRKRPKSE